MGCPRYKLLGISYQKLQKCSGRVAYQASKLASNLRSPAPGQITTGSFLSEIACQNNRALQSFLIASFSGPGRLPDTGESHWIWGFVSIDELFFGRWVANNSWKELSFPCVQHLGPGRRGVCFALETKGNRCETSEQTYTRYRGLKVDKENHLVLIMTSALAAQQLDTLRRHVWALCQIEEVLHTRMIPNHPKLLNLDIQQQTYPYISNIPWLVLERA